MRIHIVGASGSGTTTLAKALAEAKNLKVFDADDYFWAPTDPPYTDRRSKEERDTLLRTDLSSFESWVLSGSVVSWDKSLASLFSLVVYLWIPQEIRLARLKKRESARFGKSIMPGGFRYDDHVKFMEWAKAYDSAGLEQRSRAVHEKWLSRLKAPVLRIEGDISIQDRVARVVKWLGK